MFWEEVRSQGLKRGDRFCTVCYHVIRPSRGQDVIVEVMAGQTPEVWVSD